MSKRCWFHRWKFLGSAGLLNFIEECEKCGLQRVFFGVMGEWKIYPSGSWKEAKDAAQSLADLLNTKELGNE